VMSSLHGMFSVGGLLGSLAGGAAATRGWSPLMHFAVVAALLGGASLVASFRLLPARCDVAPKAAQGGWAKLPADLRRPLVLLGLVALCGMMAEGAVGDWGAIYLHGNLGTSTAVAALGYSAYSVAMAVGRFLGDRCLARWGEVRVVTRAVTVAGCAFAVGLLAGQPAAAVCGFTVLGLGLSIVMPAIFSMAGRMGARATGPAITVVSGIGGTGMLAGPPLIGFIAQATGLPAALGGISVLTLSAALLLRLATSGRDAAADLSPASARTRTSATVASNTAESPVEPAAEPVP